MSKSELVLVTGGAGFIGSHLVEALVNEGQEVSLGQVIAHMGEGAPNRPVLYFEIRRNGKPVDPLPFLPNYIK